MQQSQAQIGIDLKLLLNRITNCAERAGPDRRSDEAGDKSRLCVAKVLHARDPTKRTDAVRELLIKHRTKLNIFRGAALPGEAVQAGERYVFETIPSERSTPSACFSADFRGQHIIGASQFGCRCGSFSSTDS